MKLTNKISISFFAVALLLVSSAVSIFYIVAKDDLKKAIFNNLSTATVSRANHIETYLKMLEISVGQLSKSTVLESLLKVNGKEDSGWREAFQVATRRLKRTKEANPSICEFMLLDATGKVVASSDENILGEDKSTDAYFLGGQKGIYIKDAYFSETKKMPLMAVSAPMTESQTGEFLGVLVARVRLDELNAIVTERTGLGKTGEVYIVNKYGFMITPSRFRVDTFLKQRVDTENVRRAWLHKDTECVMPQGKMIDVFPGYRGVQVLGTHQYISQMQWAVLAEIDIKEVFAPLAKLRLIFVMILLMVPLAAWLLGMYIAYFITEPLHKLHKGAEIIGSGNLDYKVGTDAKDEVGQLSRAFDAMMQNLKKTTISVESLNKEITERKRVEEMLDKVNKCFLTFSYNPNENIRKIVETAGSVLGGACALYNKEEKAFLCTIEGWNLPEDFKRKDSKECHICYDVITKYKDEPFVINELDKTLYAENDPNVAKYNLKAYIGCAVKIREKAVGSLCVVYQKNRTFNSNELNILSVLTKALGIEEERRQADDDLKKQTQELNAALKYALRSREVLSSMLEDNNQIREKMEQNIAELEISHSQLKETQKELIQAEKLSAVGRLASGVAHEVRNPLAIIMQSVEYLANKIPPEHKEMMQMIIDNIKRADIIVRTLLDFSRKEEINMISEDINLILESSLILIQHRIGQESIKIVKEFKEGLPKVLVDKNKIEQVFVNIVINAIQAMPNGGNIFIRTYAVKFDKPKGGAGRRIGDSFKLQEKAVVIEIEDTGVGIQEENMDKVFEPFFTTKEPKAGTGLGLAVTKNIITMHKALIEIESKVGKGTKVIVTLKTEEA